MDHLLRPGQAAEIAVNDDADEAVIYKNEQIAEQPGEAFHRTSLYRFWRSGWAGERSDADRVSGRSAARISAWPRRCATSSAAPPNTTRALSPSGRWHYFQRMP